MADILQELVNKIISPSLQLTLLPIKIVFIFFSIFVVAFWIFFLMDTKWLKLVALYPWTEFFTRRIYGASRTARAWKKIKKLVEKKSLVNFEKAIVMADKQMDKLLERLVTLHQKRNYEERLDWLTFETFANIEELKKAHQIRLKIEHERDFEINIEEAERVLNEYEQAFKQLNIIK